MDSGSNPPGAMGASSGFGDAALHGLKFGKKLYFEVMGGGSGGGSSSSEHEAPAPQAPAAAAAAVRKKGKGSASGGRGRQPPPPKCQVEGCGQDLTGSKAYYCKHRVCGTHSKSPKVIVAGLEQRFCQQCSRFHQLTEFDQGKRSCRRRLAGHNERRRKPPPVPLSSRFGRGSSFHGNYARYGGFLSDFAHLRVPSASTREWPMVQATHRVTCNHWSTPMDGPPTNGMGAQIVSLYGPGPPGSAGRIIYNQEEVHPSQCHGVCDSSCALSLLSNQSWGISYASNGSPPTSADYIDTQMAQSSAMNSWISTSGGFRGPDTSCNGHGIPHEMGLGLSAGTGSRDFSGELELALQGSRKYGNHGDAIAYSPPGNLMHWPL